MPEKASYVPTDSHESKDDGLVRAAATETVARSLSYLARVKEFFLQSKSVLLHRHGRRVTRHELPAYLRSQGFAAYRELQRCADFSLAAYAKDKEIDGSETPNQIDWTTKGWRELEWEDWQEHLPREGTNLPGLSFRVWYQSESNTAVIAFRGTRFTKLADWYANLRWLTRFIPRVNDHYVQLGSVVEPLVAHLKEQHEGVSIITTGHSLGGGLAQHAAYRSPEIELVHAFASSPVTGFHSIERDVRERNGRDLLIVRSFEHGEILAYLRFFARRLVRLSEDHPRIIELRFNCSQLLAVSEHSMENMTSYLRERFLEAASDGELPPSGSGGRGKADEPRRAATRDETSEA